MSSDHYNQRPYVTVVSLPPEGAKDKGGYEFYLGRASIVLGVIQVIVGTFSIIFSIVTYFVHHTFYSALWTGVWSGVLFVIAGSLGVAAGKLKTKPLISAHLAFCILSSLAALAAMSICIFGAWFDCCYDGIYWAPPVYSWIFVGVFILETIISFIAALLCCVSRKHCCFLCT